MQKSCKKKMDIDSGKSRENAFRTESTLYFVVGNAENEKKLQIMSLPAGKIRVQYPV